jgi:hypothetical protein
MQVLVRLELKLISQTGHSALLVKWEANYILMVSMPRLGLVISLFSALAGKLPRILIGGRKFSP